MPLRLGIAILLPLWLLGSAARAQPPQPAPVPVRTARYPSLSPDGKWIAFSWQGDIWVVAASGGQARRLPHPGFDMRPRWSPDGNTIAFCSNRRGGHDIYLVPAAGGEARQLTDHAADDILGDWSPDGKQIVFYSQRESRGLTLYLIEVATGRLRQLTWDEVNAQTPAFSPDGRWIAYARGGTGAFRKRYRGSANGDIWALSLADPRHPRRITRWEGNDYFPVFGGDSNTLYYCTERDGIFNLWKTTLRGDRHTQVTRHRTGAVRYAAISHDRSTIVYECDFGLWTLSLRQRNPQPRRVEITAVPDPPAPKRQRTLTGGIEEYELSPDGRWLALGVANDIFVMPAAGGTPKRLTDDPAIDHDFSWHPDSRHLAFVSERGANMDIYVADIESGELTRITASREPESSPLFSPGGRWLAYVRGNPFAGAGSGTGIYLVPSDGGSERLVARGPFIGSYRWSPDGRWIAYSRRDLANTSDIWVVPVDGSPDDAVDVTRSADLNASPEFTPDGQHLVFLSNRGGTPEIYALPLTRKPGESRPDRVQIDFTDIHRRARLLTTQPAGSKTQYALSPDGQMLYYVVGTEIWRVPVSGGSPARSVVGFAGIFRLSPDGTRFYMGQGTIRSVSVEGGEPAPVMFSAPIEEDAAAVRRAAFDQAWRLLRDGFYDEKMHGVDWDAVYTRYSAVLGEIVTDDDWLLLLTEMVGELNASHVGASIGDRGEPAVTTAYLGFWFDYDHAGPGLKVTEVLRDGPADGLDLPLKPGQYVLAIDGSDVTASEGLFRLLNGAVGRTVELLVNDRPTREGARSVRVTLIGRQRWETLFYEHQVARARERVDRLSGGRLAYVHIRSMDQPSLARFQRELRSIAFEKEGLIIDVRWNGGGRTHDELLALLAPRVHAYETPRGGLAMTQPFGAYNRPMVLLINQGSASDAEVFPNGFRVNRLGKIVGVPTSGGVIGTIERRLLDGRTTWRIPRTGWTTLEGRNMENWGVPPDIYVERLPADYAADRDPQLERAVEVLLEEIGRSRRATPRNGP